MNFTATRVITATSGDVLRTLEDIRTLASWNPAIGAIESNDARAVVGKQYRTRLRGTVTATIVFEQIVDGSVRYRMDALGSSETGSWTWTETMPNCTSVTHSFTHDGFLINLMSHAFEQVPSWRLERLGIETARRTEEAVN